MLDQTLTYIMELSMTHTYLFYGFLLFISSLCSLGFPINSDIIQITVSYLIYKGSVSYSISTPMMITGILIGDAILYFISHRSGKLVIKKKNSETFKKISALINKYGALCIFIARFLPGIRTLFIVSAGVTNLPFYKMILADFLGAIIVIPTLLYSVTFFAGNTEKMNSFIDHAQSIAGYLLLIILTGLVFFIYRLRQKTN